MGRLPITCAKNIMTPKKNFVYFDKDNSEESIEKAKSNNVDFLPVKNKGRITSVYIINESKKKAVERKGLISGDTSITDLIKIFLEDKESKRPGYFIIQGQEIVGIVTEADLNKHQSRLFFFGVIIQIEEGLIEIIQEKVPNYMDHLSKEDQYDVNKYYERMKEEKRELTKLHNFSFSHLGKVAQNALWKELGFSSTAKAKKAFKTCSYLRNSTVHLTRPLFTDLKTLNSQYAVSNDIHEKIKALL